MRRSILFLFVLALAVSVATAQGGSGGGTPPSIPTTFVPPFTVSLTEVTPVPINPIIIHENPLYDLTAISFDIKADSEDVQINGFSFGVAYNFPNEKGEPKINNVLVYSESTLLDVLSKFDVYPQSHEYNFAFNFTVPAFVSKTITIKFDQIFGSGDIQPTINMVQGETKTGRMSYTYSQTIVGNRFEFVNPDLTATVFYHYPDISGDTMYVYPGQGWYAGGSYYTAWRNFLPNIITACEVTGNNFNDYELRDQADGYMHIKGASWGDDTVGTSFTTESGNVTTLKWYSNSSSGLDNFLGCYWSGINYAPVNETRLIWSNAEIIIYSPFFDNVRSNYYFKRTIIKSIDGIRGDVNGDGIVDFADLSIMAAGQSADSMFCNSKINFGRSLIFFSWPAFVDGWAVNVYIHKHNDPAIKDLGIGELMSERPPLTPVPTVSSLSGNTMTVKTKGFAVNVSTLLPNGKIWSKCERVSGGQVAIDVPDANLKYRIESVSLSSEATNVDEGLEIPTKFDLSQNYPNPFNPTTTISFSVQNSGPVTLKVYNLLGQEVATLFEGEKSAGNYTADFNANKLSSGIYIYRLTAGNFISTKKMVLMK